MADLDLTDFEFDPEDLTLNEVEIVEELLGEPIDKVISGDKLKAKPMKVIAMVLLSRTNPGITLEQAGELKLRAINPGDKPGE